MYFLRIQRNEMEKSRPESITQGAGMPLLAESSRVRLLKLLVQLYYKVSLINLNEKISRLSAYMYTQNNSTL